jgi:hypothetical protein
MYYNLSLPFISVKKVKLDLSTYERSHAVMIDHVMDQS